MTSDAQTNTSKHVKSNIACAGCQRNTEDSIFWLAQVMLCLKMLHNFQSFIGTNAISDGPTNGISIHQSYFLNTHTNLDLWHSSNKQRFVVCLINQNWNKSITNMLKKMLKATVTIQDMTFPCLLNMRGRYNAWKYKQEI